MVQLTRWKGRSVTLKRRVVARENPARLISETSLIGRVSVKKGSYSPYSVKLGHGVERRYWFADEETGRNYRLSANGKMRVYAENSKTLVMRVYE